MAEAATKKTNLKLTDAGSENVAMPLVDMKMPRLFAALMEEFCQEEFCTPHVAGAAILMFLYASKKTREAWINKMRSMINQAQGLTRDTVPNSQDVPGDEAHIFAAVVNDTICRDHGYSVDSDKETWS